MKQDQGIIRVIVGREDHAFKVELCPTALKNALSPW